MTTTMSKADEAVAHLLRAIQDDGRKAWLLGRGSRSFELFTEAYAHRIGQDLAGLRERIWSNCRPTEMREVEADEEA